MAWPGLLSCEMRENSCYSFENFVTCNLYNVNRHLRYTYRAVGEPWRRSTDLTVLVRAIADYLGVDSTRHTVVELGIQLRQSESWKWKIVNYCIATDQQLWVAILTCVHASLSDVSHSSSFHNVTNDKLLDGLILGNTTSTIGATDGTDVSATVLRASIVSAFASLKEKKILGYGVLTSPKRGVKTMSIW